MNEIERYAGVLCEALKIDSSGVFKGGHTMKTKERVVRHLIIQKFHGVVPTAELAKILGMTTSSLCHSSLRFKHTIRYSPAFKLTVQFLEDKGLVESKNPTKTHELSKRLDTALDHIEKLMKMLDQQKNEIYEMKKTLPKVWEV